MLFLRKMLGLDMKLKSWYNYSFELCLEKYYFDVKTIIDILFEIDEYVAWADYLNRFTANYVNQISANSTDKENMSLHLNEILSESASSINEVGLHKNSDLDNLSNLYDGFIQNNVTKYRPLPNNNSKSLSIRLRALSLSYLRLIKNKCLSDVDNRYDILAERNDFDNSINSLSDNTPIVFDSMGGVFAYRPEDRLDHIFYRQRFIQLLWDLSQEFKLEQVKRIFHQ